MVKIRQFTHKDLDGYACYILSEISLSNDVKCNFCDYDDINLEVEKILDDGSYKQYDIVVITDISISNELAARINKIENHNFVLIDHHQTALHLNQYQWCNVATDVDGEKTCGASLYYDFLMENSYIIEDNKIIEFVEKTRRYDTWLWKEKYNDIDAYNLNTLLYLYGPKKFCNSYIYKLRLEQDIFGYVDKMLIELEEAKTNDYIEKHNKKLIIKNQNIGNKSYKFGIVFAENYTSILGNRLCEMHPELDFVMIISGLESISFRGIKNDINIGADIATLFGGGGHPKAAGATIPKKKMEDIIQYIIE